MGELVHLLIEDLDLDGGWLHVRNKTELGWRVKTGEVRSVPLLPEVVAVVRTAIGKRTCGPVFLREKQAGTTPALVGDRRELARVCEERQQAARVDGQPLTREEAQKIAWGVWWDAGVVKADVVRASFVRVMKGISYPEANCRVRNGVGCCVSWRVCSRGSRSQTSRSPRNRRPPWCG